MYQVITVIHVLLGLCIIGLVMMQQGKGADAGASFGSGTSGSVFGAQGAASFLSRSTAIFATLFFTTSLGLAIINGHKDKPIDLMAVPETEKSSVVVPQADPSKSNVPTQAPVAKAAVKVESATATNSTVEKTAEPVKIENLAPQTPVQKVEIKSEPAKTADKTTEKQKTAVELPKATEKAK